MFKTFIVFFFCIILSGLFAQEKFPTVKFSGVTYNDFFYNIDQIDQTQKDLNGFRFRRIYFTGDFGLSETFSSRFRLEADEQALTSNNKIGVMVKDAYLKWKEIFCGSDLFFGISPTPSFQVSEEAWGYRSLEKTILDLRGIVSSRDFGVDLKGKINESGSINYWIKIANNSGNSPEANKYKRYYALFHFKPLPGFEFTVSGDYDTRPKKKNLADSFENNDRITTSIFAAYKEKNKYSVGVESFLRKTNNNFTPITEDDLVSENSYGISVYGWMAISEKFFAVLRTDYFEPNSELKNDALLYWIAGLDYRPINNVSIIPNIYAQFLENSNRRDVIGRVTFAYSF